MKKRIISLILVLALVVAMVPAVGAVDTEEAEKTLYGRQLRLPSFFRASRP